MTRYWLSGIGALAMMAGPAFAQGLPTDITNSQTTTTTTAVAPPVGTYSTSKSQKIIDSNGVETQKSESYVSGVDGVRSSSNTQTVAPDGSVLSATHEDRTTVPTGETTTTSTTTSTTTDQ
jgi:hypothetical protein